MKKILISILALSSVFGLQSCSEDFEVAAPYKNVTIIYGLLNMQDTAHYIRIQKAFLDENKSAFEMAKVADSSFYKESDLDVKIKEFNGLALVGTPVTLTRVKMEDEGYPKDSGTFFSGPNYAYKFKKTLDPAHTYRLVVTNVVTGATDSAEISIIDADRLKFNSWEPTSNLFLNFAFTNNPSTNKYQLFVDPGNAKYIEGMIRFFWVEKNLNTGTQTEHSADFPFGSTDTVKKMLEAQNLSFYNFLASEMKPAGPGIERYMDSCDLYVHGSGREYLGYLNALQVQSTGLTTDQIKPVFTNILGKDVFGLFTSRTTRMKHNVIIDNATMDSLKFGTRVKDLNIKGRSDH